MKFFNNFRNVRLAQNPSNNDSDMSQTSGTNATPP